MESVSQSDVMQGSAPINLEDVRRALGEAGPFAEVAPGPLEAFIDRAEVLFLAPGGLLFDQGDSGDAIYFVVSGRLDVVVTRPDGRPQRLTQLGAGAFTGGMALLAGRARGATVRAATEAVLVKMAAAEIEALAVAWPQVKAAILELTARRLPMLHLASMDLFRGLHATLLAEFNRASHWLRLPGGAVLFEQGDPGDCLFVVAQGRLEVIVEHEDGTREVVAHVGQGECIGEMALLTGERRFATVRALRDCELIRLSGEECRRVLMQRPRAILELTQVLVTRLRDTTAGRRPAPGVSTIAVAPAVAPAVGPGGGPFAGAGLAHARPDGRSDGRAGDRALHAQVARELVAALARQGRRVLHLHRRAIEEQLGPGSADASSEQVESHRVLRWIGEQEAHYHHVVFECDALPSAWSARCLRQADLALFVADASADAAPRPHEIQLRAGELGYAGTPRELVLVHADRATPRDTGRWLAEGRFARHHHVRAGAAADYERVARLVTGRAHGLVLGGGGARGFAHLGALRAFEERRVPIDIIGGTSMGAIIGAQYAAGAGVDAIVEAMRRGFVQQNPICDYTVPLVSLITGNRMARVLTRMFGEARIEDQWRPFFCVATNLSRATIAVHRQGPLAFAVGTSAAVPGLAPPLIQDGDFLVDGGLLDNVPVAVMRQVSSGTVFAVDVSQRVEFRTTREPYTHLSGWRVLRDRLGLSRRRDADPVPSMLKLLWRSTVLNSVHRSAAVRRSSDVYIHPALDGIEIFDWREMDRAIEAGYRTTLESLDRWRDATARRDADLPPALRDTA